MEFPQDIFKLILSFVPIDPPGYKEFKRKVIEATRKGKKLKFDRFVRNLRYDANGLYSYTIRVVQFNIDKRTYERLGRWSMTTSRHQNWACNHLKEMFEFKEIKN